MTNIDVCKCYIDKIARDVIVYKIACYLPAISRYLDLRLFKISFVTV